MKFIRFFTQDKAPILHTRHLIMERSPCAHTNVQNFRRFLCKIWYFSHNASDFIDPRLTRDIMSR